MEPRNRFQGMNSASLCSLAGRYDNPIPPRFIAPIDSSKIPAQIIYQARAFKAFTTPRASTSCTYCRASAFQQDQNYGHRSLLTRSISHNLCWPDADHCGFWPPPGLPLSTKESFKTFCWICSCEQRHPQVWLPCTL
jgi:hypothetical protein